MSATKIAVLVSLFIVLADNRLFWRSLFAAADPRSTQGALFAVSAFIILAGALTVLFLLFSLRPLFRPFLMFMLVLAAIIGYFGSAYSVVIDGGMVRNVLATDRREAGELLTVALAVHVLLLGMLPAAAVGFVRVRAEKWDRALRSRAISVAVILGLVLTGGLMNYRQLTLIGREHKELRLSINPLYAFYAVAKYALRSDGVSGPVTQIGADARKETGLAGNRRTLVVLVVGETAREKEFSLNGYERRTNPELERDGVVSFTNAYACATSTADSLPCMFSNLSQGEFSVVKAMRSENVLDILSRAGVSVLWRDNNSGCKGVCARVATEDLSHAAMQEVCTGEECYDEVLLDRFAGLVDSGKGDSLIILHQKGSHGPAYYKRHPLSFSAFGPECRSDAPQNCPTDEIVNAYDNSILYTDHFLHRTIELLKKSSADIDTMMVYFSDHGESLGERGLYLHGLPSFIAPDEQKHVPFIVWLSDGYARDHAIDQNCLRAHRTFPYSHANLFHSLLGAFRVRTDVYVRDQDVFAACRTS